MNFKKRIFLIVLLPWALFAGSAQAGVLKNVQVKTLFDHEYLLLKFDVDPAHSVKKLVFYSAEQRMAVADDPDSTGNKVFFLFLPGANTIEVQILDEDGGQEREILSLSQRLFQDFFRQYGVPEDSKDRLFALAYFLNIDTALSEDERVKHARAFLEDDGKGRESAFINLFQTHPEFYLKWLVKHEAVFDRKMRKILNEYADEIMGDETAQARFFEMFIRLIVGRMELGLTLRAEGAGDVYEKIEALKNEGTQDLLVSCATLFYDDEQDLDPTGFYYNNGYSFLGKALLLPQNETVIEYMSKLVQALKDVEALKERIKKLTSKEPEIYSYTSNIILDELVKILPDTSEKRQKRLAELIVLMAISSNINDKSLAGEIYHQYLFSQEQKEHDDWFYDWLALKGDEMLAEQDYAEALKFYQIIYEHGKEKERDNTFFINYLRCLFIQKECSGFDNLVVKYGERFPSEYREIFSNLKEVCTDDEKAENLLTQEGSINQNLDRESYLTLLTNSGYDPLKAKRIHNEELAKREGEKSKIPVSAELRERFPELVELIFASSSMDDDERRYWFSVLPIMTEPQVAELYDILITEKRKLAAIDLKYSSKLSLKKLDKKVYEFMGNYTKSPIKCSLLIDSDLPLKFDNQSFKEEILTNLKGKINLTEESAADVKIIRGSDAEHLAVQLEDKFNKKKYFKQVYVGDDIDSAITGVANLLDHWLEDIKNETGISFYRAASYYSGEKWEKALVEFERLSAYFKDSTFIREYLIEIYGKLSDQFFHTDSERAIQFDKDRIKLLEAVGDSEKLKNSKIHLAGLYHNLNQHQKAIQIYEDLSKEFPDDKEVMIEYMFTASGIDKELAEDILSKFLKTFDSLSASEEGYVASVYSDLKNCKEAIKHGERAIRKSDHHWLYYIYGQVIRNCGLPLDAIKVYEMGIDINPNYYPLYYGYGYALIEIGELDKAISSFQKVIELTSAKDEHADSYQSIGIAYLLKNDLESGFESIDKAADLDSGLSLENPSSISYKQSKLYNCSIMADLTASSEIYNEIEANKEDVPKDFMDDVEWLMADTYLLNNMFNESKTHLGNAISFDSEYPGYYYKLALINDLNHSDETDETLQQAIQSDEQDPTFTLEYWNTFPIEHKYYLMGLVAEEQKDIQYALEIWKQLESDINTRLEAYDAYLQKDRDTRRKETVSKYKAHFIALQEGMRTHLDRLIAEIE